MHKIPILLTSHYQLKYEVHFFSSGEQHFLKGKDRHIRHVQGGFAPTLADAGEHFLTQGHPIGGCLSPESVWIPWLWTGAELAVGLSTHTPALQSTQLPGKSSKSAGQED